MTIFFYITAEGLVYGAPIRRLYFETDALPFISKILSGKSVAATFNALSQRVDIKWKLRDQPIWPFGDGDLRQALSAVYNFDLDVDILYYSEQHRNLQIPLARFRTKGTVPSLDDCTPFQPPSPPKINPLAFPSPSWKPSIPVSSRKRSFVTRILTDFGFLWRHILRHSYTDAAFHKLARSVIAIAQLDFQTAEQTSRWKHQCEGPGSYVNLCSEPTWPPYENQVVRIGTVTLVLDQDLEKAMEIARRDIAQTCEHGKRRDSKPHSDLYILLSVRHIVLCRGEGQEKLSYTHQAALLDGINAPSYAGIDLLLQALSAAFFCLTPSTRLHKLPPEIQDRIMEYVSEGRIESAKLGCILDLGLPFDWMRNDPTRRGGPIEIFLSPQHRFNASPVETKIYFGDVFSGLVYR